MSKQLATIQGSAITADTLHSIVTAGDLGKLSQVQLIDYYIETCESLGLNWRTKPFDVVSMRNGPKKLYLNSEGAEQLSAIHNVNVETISSGQVKDVYQVVVRASLPNGRSCSKSGAVAVGNLSGQALGDAMMKAETKAARRAIRGLCGMAGLLQPKETGTFIRPPDAAEVLADIEQPPSLEVLASDEPVDEIIDVESTELSPLQLAKRRLWQMAQVRGLDHDELKKLAGIYNFVLEDGTVAEYEEITKQLIDHEDAKAIIAEYQEP